MKKLLGRALMGLLVTALFFLLLEGALRLVLGPPAPSKLVRQRWNADAPAFYVENGTVAAVFQDRDMIPYFSAEPQPGVVRVMVFGESSVRGGSHLDLTQEFPALLEQELRARGLSVEVLNLGRPAMDSYGLRLVVEQALAFKPQIAVIYTGHNDIGNAYMMARFGSVSSALVGRVQLAAERMQLYTLLRGALNRRSSQSTAVDMMQVDTLNPLPPVQRRMAETTFQRNLDGVVALLQQNGVRVVLSTVGADLTVWRSAAPVCPDALPQGAWRSDMGRWDLVPELVGFEAAEAALKASPDCPEALFLRGLGWAAKNEGVKAYADLEAARDLDRVPLRATTGIEEAIRAVAAARQVPLVDFERALRSVDVPSTMFVDPVHPSSEGHRKIAQEILPVLAEQVAAVAAGG